MRIDSRQMIALCNQFLKFYDSRLVEHGERVACIACKLMAQFEHREQLELKNVVLLALFHDIGAYKTEEILPICRRWLRPFSITTRPIPGLRG